MQRREQYLLIGLVAAVVLWFGGGLVSSQIMGPLRDKQAELTRLETKNDESTKSLLLLAKQRKNLSDWTRRSLPPDPVKGKNRPSALNAQRLYQDWLHDLAQLSGFDDLKVLPDRTSVSKDNVYVSVSVKIEADARYEQLCRFLDRFYRTDLLHRVASLRVTTNESEGDPLLKIVLEAEGLALIKAPQVRRLFSQTILAEDLLDDATVMIVTDNEDFPTKPGFRIRVRNEYMKVTAIDGTAWTIERGQDATTPANHPLGTIVGHVRQNDEVSERSADEIKQMLSTNIFVKPAPPVQYKPRISTLSEKIVTRGKPIDFNIVFLGYDPSRGKPEFSLVEPLLPGARLDKVTGKFSWNPSADQKTGTYTFKFDIKHPSAAGGKLVESVKIALIEPNTAPKVATGPVPVVFLGRTWKFSPTATDAETSSAKLTWKLGEGSPAGMEIDSKTGVMTWTPGDSVDVGDVTVSVVVSDDGTPPQSTTQSLKLKVQDDAAMFTFLTTIFSVNGNVLAKLYDRSQDKQTELRVGTQFAVADIKGTVTRIDQKYLLFNSTDGLHRLELGQSLREFTTEKVDKIEVPDATLPANAGSKATTKEAPVEADVEERSVD
ncbi:MAG: hypothetical protein JSS49_17445 [Planctomycetes bacterium]|nr:hypothetical protein [Planctomycetota bacterium]